MENLKDPENWNVRMIQKGELIEDTLYSPYVPMSIGFDDLEGYFYHRDYEDCKKLDKEERSTYLFPAHNSNISFSDYYSVSVSLPHYLKMLKGEKEMPKGFSKEPRIEYIKQDNICYMHCAAEELPEEIISYCKNFLK